MKRIRVCDRSETDYPAVCGIGIVNGELYVVPADYRLLSAMTLTDDNRWYEAAEEYFGLEPNVVAVVLFTHVAYAQPGNAQQWAVDIILEAASIELGIPYAIRQGQ